MKSKQFCRTHFQDLTKAPKLSFYHDRLKSTTLIRVILGTVSFMAGSGAIEAADLDLVVEGELELGGKSLSGGEADSDYIVFLNSELDIKVEASFSEELMLGAKVVLEADADSDNNEDNEDIKANESFLFVSGAFGLIEAGRAKGAEDAMALGANSIAAGTGGIDGDTDNLGIVEVINSEDAAKVSYFTPRIANLQFGLSFTPDTGDDDFSLIGKDDEEEVDLKNHVGLGLNFVHTLGELDLGLAAVGSFGQGRESAEDDLSAFSLGGTVTLGDLELGASYGANNDAEDSNFGTIGATFGFGEANTGIGYNYVNENEDGVTHVIALSGDVALLEWVEVLADVSYADTKNQSSDVATILAVELSF